MALIIAVLLFAGFAADVFMGATTGTSFLTDVQQMLVLFAATIAFVVAILKREHNEKNN